MTLADIQEIKNWIQQVLLWLSSSLPINYTCYQYTAVGKYCNLCVQMLDGANWHEAPWKPGLFTFDCEVDSDSVCFYQQINDTNLHFLGQINGIWKLNHI